MDKTVYKVCSVTELHTTKEKSILKISFVTKKGQRVMMFEFGEVSLMSFLNAYWKMYWRKLYDIRFTATQLFTKRGEEILKDK